MTYLSLPHNGGLGRPARKRGSGSAAVGGCRRGSLGGLDGHLGGMWARGLHRAAIGEPSCRVLSLAKVLAIVPWSSWLNEGHGVGLPTSVNGRYCISTHLLLRHKPAALLRHDWHCGDLLLGSTGLSATLITRIRNALLANIALGRVVRRPGCDGGIAAGSCRCKAGRLGGCSRHRGRD